MSGDRMTGVWVRIADHKLWAGESDEIGSQVVSPILISRQPVQRCCSVHPLLPCSSRSWTAQRTLNPLLSLTCWLKNTSY